MLTSRFAQACLFAVVAPLFVLGLVVSPLSLGIAAVLVAFVVFYRYAVAVTTEPAARRGAFGRVLRQVRWVALGVLAVGPTTAGLVSIVGPMGLPVLVLVAGAALLWAHRTRSTRPAETSPTARPTDASRPTGSGAPRLVRIPFVLPRPDADMTTDALCHAWRMSDIALRSASEPGAQGRIVELRSRYLDELERRDPAGFARWIHDGARAAGDPAPYIARSSDPEHRSN